MYRVPKLYDPLSSVEHENRYLEKYKKTNLWNGGSTCWFGPQQFSSQGQKTDETFLKIS